MCVMLIMVFSVVSTVWGNGLSWHHQSTGCLSSKMSDTNRRALEDRTAEEGDVARRIEEILIAQKKAANVAAGGEERS